MGESKAEGSAGTSAPTLPDKAEAPAHAAPSAAPVQGVPVGQHPQYYPQYQEGPGYQNRPLGYGSYGTQGAPGAATHPYHNQAQPQSFEVQEVHRPHERLPCLIGYQLILFIFGWFFPILWYLGAFLPLCVRRIDPREKLGWLINSAAAVVFTIILIIVLCRYRYYYNSYTYGPY